MYLAIDVGGTKTLLAVMNDAGEVIEQAKFPTNENYQEFLAAVSTNLHSLKTSKFTACGLAIPGKIDREHGVGKTFGNLPWENVHIVSDFEALLQCPVSFENDAKLAGLSEARLIKDEFRKVLYVTIGTGIGTAMIIDGTIDPNYADSEAGFMLLEHEGKLEYWDDFASGSAIKQKYGMKASDITDSQAWYEIARNIALGLIDLVATLTPDVIILGGGVGAHLEKFQDRLTEDLKIYENPMLRIPPIRKAAHPEEAVLFGCLELIKDHRHAH